MPLKVVRVLAVADASVLAGIRRALPAGSIELVATASTPVRALSELRRVYPDVVVLDLGLTQTDVFQLLPQLMQEQNTAVLALTSGPDAASQAERAWDAGASDVVERPSASPVDVASAHTHTLSLRLLALAAAQRPRTSRPSLPIVARSPKPPSATLLSKPASPLQAAPATRTPMPLPAASRPKPPAGLLAIGASTGGTLALTELLSELPAKTPPVLVVQHMLPEFTYDFAERLNAACALQVRQAVDGAVIEAGHVLIAPGGKHMRLARDASGALCARVTDEAPVNKHRPSVDVLFNSCAEVLGPASVGVLLTGMGDDGARGLLTLRNAGARTIVQDQASSACFGMPSAAIALGAAEQVLSLRGIAHVLRELASQSESWGPR